jgi:iron(III) transport system substrate-binding protein
MKRLLLLGLAAALLVAACGGPSAAPAPTAAPASGKPTTIEELARYRGSDRQQILEAGAKKEGKVLWYTTLIVNQAVRPLVDAFRQKYPYIEVDTWRANSNEVAQRVLQEYQANRHEVDLADGTNTPAFLRAQDVTRPFFSPALEAYPTSMKDKDGWWAATNVYFMTVGYNTGLVPKGTQPKTYEDLLDAKWMGKMAWSTSAGSGGPGFVGNVLEAMGQDKGMQYLTNLAKQNVHNVNSAARAVLDMTVAGEFPIALQIFNHHAVISAQSGAPVDWQPLEPVLGQVQGIALAKHAAHPHATLLFLDFLFSETEGQQIMRDVEYLPAHPKVEAKTATLKPEQGGFKVNFVTPERAFEKEREWDQTFKKLFIQ